MSFIVSVGYKIEIGEKAIASLGSFLKKNSYSKYFILCDENTLLNCLPALINRCNLLKDAEIFEIESGEQSKDLTICAHLWQSLLDNQADKNSLFINLGGGVVSDLGGFVASLYKRGIDFINIPTSLLAMADASVGGKTGIDFSGSKNMIGIIKQPKAVFIYPPFLKSLSPKHFKNGMAEIFKMALISDKVLWKKLNSKIAPTEELLITKSVELKNKIVKKDPEEKNTRKALNFGHTIGHALEALYLGKKSELLHGEAIVIGMIAEAHLSFQHKLITKNQLDTISNSLLSYFQPNVSVNSTDTEILKLIMNDKKNTKGQINCSLLSGIGKHKLNVAVNALQIKKSLEFYNSLFK